MTARDDEEKRPPRERDTGKKAPDERSRPKPDTKKPEPPRLRGFDDWASF